MYVRNVRTTIMIPPFRKFLFLRGAMRIISLETEISGLGDVGCTTPHARNSVLRLQQHNQWVAPHPRPHGSHRLMRRQRAVLCRLTQLRSG